MAVTEHAVVIAGGGPTGLMLAAELALAGVDVVIVETARQPGPRRLAGGWPARRGRIEVLDQRGIADRFLAEGHGDAGPGLRLDPARHRRLSRRGTTTGSRSGRTDFERILAAWVDELGVPIAPRAGGDRVRAGRRRRRRRARPTASRCERPTSSGATAGAAWSGRPPASSSPAGIRRSAGSSPRSR